MTLVTTDTARMFPEKLREALIGAYAEADRAWLEVDALRERVAESDALRARVAELEAELAKLRGGDAR